MEKRATLRDVASLAGVSVATASYVLNGKKAISEATIAKVHAAIQKLDYVPDLSARGLTIKDTRLIGIVVPQTEPGSRLMFQNGFYGEILGSIEYHARIKGYHVIISATDVNESYMKLVRERNLDGVIVIGTYPNDFFEELDKLKIPVVLIDSYCSTYDFVNVRIDDTQGSYLATKYILDKGHRKVAFFTGCLKEEGVMQKRYLGVQKAMAEFQIQYPQEYIFEGEVDYDSGIYLAKEMLARQLGITAIVASADILAIGAMKGLSEAGVKVPEDISIIGFDDLEIAKYLVPGLTTVKQRISAKGEEAVNLLVTGMNQEELPGQDVILPVHVVERDSVIENTKAEGSIYGKNSL